MDRLKSANHRKPGEAGNQAQAEALQGEEADKPDCLKKRNKKVKRPDYSFSWFRMTENRKILHCHIKMRY